MGDLNKYVFELFRYGSEDSEVISGNFNINRCPGRGAFLLHGNGYLAAGDIFDAFTDISHRIM